MTRSKRPTDAAGTPAHHLVHPRAVWGGTGLTVVGLVVVCVGLIARTRPGGVVGLLAMAIGVVVAWRGGVLRDVHTTSAAVDELSDVRRGRVHRGVRPGQMVSTPAARMESEAADAQRRELLERSHRTRGPVPARGAAIVMLLVCVVLVCAQWMLYPTGRTAQDNALRSLGLSIVLVLCALRILTSSRPRRVAGLVAMLIGLVLGLFGPLAAHQEVGVAWVEAALGAVVVLAGGAVVFSRNPS